MNAVDQIMRFIATYCQPLLTDYGFQIIESSCDYTRPDTGSVLLESQDVECYFVVERGIERSELLLDFRSKYDTRKRNWFSFYLIRKLLSKEGDEVPATALMNESSNSSFLRDHLPEIVDLFKVQQIERTLEQLNHLKRPRPRTKK